MAIYSISKYFKFMFICSPIKDVIVTQLDSFQNNNQIESFLERANKLFDLPNSDKERDFDQVIDIEIPTFIDLLVVKLKAIVKNKKIKIQVTNPYRIMENYPLNYKKSMKILENFTRLESKNENLIVAHIRRGISFEHISPGEKISRMLNEEYYIGIIKKITTGTSQPFKLLILTDAPEFDTFYQPIEKDYEKWNQYNHYKQGRKVQIQGHSFSKIKETFGGEIEIIRGGDVLDAIEQIRRASYFIMSRSSMSYVGALLNERGKIYYPPDFWHKPMKNWIKNN